MQIARILLLLLLVVLVFGELSPAQVTWSNGALGFNLSNAGRIRVGLSPYVSASRELDRLTPVAAFSKTAVFDYNEDANSNAEQLASRIVVAGADSAFECLTDNSFANLPPKVKVRVAAMSWTNGRYLIARYRLINDTTITVPLSFGTIALPYVGSAYGGETIKYHAASKTGYYYRQGLAKYWGVRLLGKTPTSFKVLDWDVYSTDPNSEVTTDSVRYYMATGAGFDSLAAASVDGSLMELNAGQVTLAPHDSATFYYAVVYGTTLPEMLASVDSAVARYTKVFTSVRNVSSVIPTEISLSQNYPNPFNPTTKIDFQILRRSWARLTVFDLLGRLVATPVNANLTAGSYTAEFNAERLPSGVYLYRLETDGTVQSRRMVLVK